MSLLFLLTGADVRHGYKSQGVQYEAIEVLPQLLGNGKPQGMIDNEQVQGCFKVLFSCRYFKLGVALIQGGCQVPVAQLLQVRANKLKSPPAGELSLVAVYIYIYIYLQLQHCVIERYLSGFLILYFKLRNSVYFLVFMCAQWLKIHNFNKTLKNSWNDFLRCVFNEITF